mgnify:CR=1 FL=1
MKREKLLQVGEKFADVGELILKNPKAILTMAGLLMVRESMAQTLDLDKIDSQSKSGIKMIYNIAKWVVIVVLMVGLISVVYMVISNNQRSKEAVIAFVVALIIVGIAYAVIPVPQ